MTKRSNRPDSPGILSTTSRIMAWGIAEPSVFSEFFSQPKQRKNKPGKSLNFWKGKQVAGNPILFISTRVSYRNTVAEIDFCRETSKLIQPTHCLKFWGIWIWMTYIYACKSAVLVALPRNPCYSWQTFVDAREHLTCTYMPSADVVLYSNQKLRTWDSQNFITYYRDVGMK